MPISQMYMHSKGWTGKDLHTLCKYKMFFMWNAAGFSKQRQDFGILHWCSFSISISHKMPQPQTISIRQEVFWVREGKKMFETPFCPCRLSSQAVEGRWFGWSHTACGCSAHLRAQQWGERQKLVFPALPQVTLCNLLITAITCLLRWHY